jgi:mono/diheme cytochrome c family protein
MSENAPCWTKVPQILIGGIFLIAPYAVLAADIQAGQKAEIERGHAVFEKWCAPCHAPISGDERLPGTSTLQLVYKGSKPAALEKRTDLTAGLVAIYVRHGINAMPWFRKTEISDAELKALGDYLARNNTGK